MQYVDFSTKIQDIPTELIRAANVVFQEPYCNFSAEELRLRYEQEVARLA